MQRSVLSTVLWMPVARSYQKYKAEGVLDGYNEKLLDCLINPEPKPNSHNDALYIPI